MESVRGEKPRNSLSSNKNLFPSQRQAISLKSHCKLKAGSELNVMSVMLTLTQKQLGFLTERTARRSCIAGKL